MKRFDGWLIELRSTAPGSRFLATDGNDDAFWTSERSCARRFTTMSAAQRFIDRNIEGAVARRHQW